MKNNLVRLFLETSPLDLSWRLLQRMADAVVAVRPGRKFPRDMKKVRVPGFPRAVQPPSWGESRAFAFLPIDRPYRDDPHSTAEGRLLPDE